MGQLFFKHFKARRERIRATELLQQFRDAAGLFADRPALIRNVDITTPIPMVTALPAIMGQLSQMTSECLIKPAYKPDMDPQFNIAFYNNGVYFAAISASLKIADGKIQLIDMRFDREHPGFSPYAVRHMIEVLREVKDLAVSTGSMHEFRKLQPLEKMGFQIIENATGKSFALTNVLQGMEPCRAVIPFDDVATMENLFSNFGLPANPLVPIQKKSRRKRLVQRMRRALGSKRL